LARTFLASACRELELPPLSLSAPTLELLRAYAWPSNVRELRNVIERAVVLCTGKAILPEHLPPSVLNARAPLPELDGAAGLPSEIRSLERARIIEVLDRCGGNQTKAAELLGVSRRTLVSQLAEFGLPRPRKGDGAS
jgi:two-component system, NtrC family, response regulator AtoC